MIRVLFIVFVIGFLNIFETIYFFKNGETKFGNPLWTVWLLWGVSFAALVVIYFMRRHLQKKYIAIANNNTFDDEYMEKDADYYYQLPIVSMVDNMPITITGHKNMRFELHFNNAWQKFLTLFDILNSAGLNLSSNENKVIMKPIKPIRHLNRYIYDVYVNERFYGTLRSEKGLKEKGIEKYLHFIFDREQEEFNIENEYLSLDLTMKNNNNDKDLYAKRNFFTLEKDKKTGKRGEQHKVNIFPTNIPDEILLAIYVQLMNVKNY